MRQFLFIFVAFALFTGCQPKVEKSAEAFRVLRTFSKKQKLENQLETFGVGGAMFDSIKTLSLDLASHQKLEVAQARLLFVKTSQELLQMINSDLKLRPFLHHYPFTIDDLEYAIAFWDDQSRFYGPPFVAYVTVIRGNIYYRMVEPATQEFVAPTYSESYEEAAKRSLND